MEKQEDYEILHATFKPEGAGGPLVVRPVMDIQAMLDNRGMIMALLRQVMIKDIDYGQIPGTPRPCLYKNGAEKLERFFGLRVIPELIEKQERWSDGQSEAFFRYTYRAQAFFGDTIVGQMDGTCHSHEDKYRWRWLPETEVPFYLDKSNLVVKIGAAWEYKWAVDKGDSIGPHGKPPGHWQMFRDAIAAGMARPIKRRTKAGKEMSAWEIDTTVYRIPNPDVESQAHTIAMIAQKRAYVAVISRVSNASDVFLVNELAEEDGDRDLSEADDMRVDTRVFGNAQNADPKKDADDLYGKTESQKRPWDSGKLIEMLNKKANKYRKQSEAWLGPPPNGLLGAMVGKLNEILGDDTRRHAFLYVVTGKSSSKELDHAQVKAVMDWMEADKVLATEEGNQLVNAQIAVGMVGELFDLSQEKRQNGSPE